MIFENPQLLYGLFIVPLFAIFILFMSKNQQKAMGKLGDSPLLKKLTVNINWSGRRWKNTLWLIALTLFIFTIARPQWGQEVREINQEGLQVMVALDVSESMLAQDIKPNRLERAKLEIADLMDRLDGDEIGLVLFSGASFIQVPLTSDYYTALTYLDNAKPEVISRPGTVIGDAIRTAMFGYDPNLTSQKVLIVMTDGEDRETDPIAATQDAADENVLIYTIGFGSPDGEPIPLPDENGAIIDYKRDQNGEVVLSKLEEDTLLSIAQTGNGKYYRAGADGSELESLLAEIDTLQKEQLNSRVETTHIERYQIFLGAVLAVLVISELIPDRLSRQAAFFRIQRKPNRSQDQSTLTDPSWIR